MTRPVLLTLALASAAALLLGRPGAYRTVAASPATPEADRSPVDLALTPDGAHLLVVNQTSSTLSLVRLSDGSVTSEVPTGERPSAVALTPDGTRVLVTGTFGGDLRVYERVGERLEQRGSVRLPFEPRGVAVSPDGATAYVAQTTKHSVTVVDLQTLAVTTEIPSGRWPRYLALSPDGSRLAVGANADGGVCVVDTRKREKLFIEDFIGINLGQMAASKNGTSVYVPWMVYRHNAITPQNIRIGWVLASRIARVKLGAKARREAIALDPQGEAVADPHGLAVTPDEQYLACAASGTQELLVYKLAGLPFQDYGGPGDHIDPKLLADKERFWRIPLGGRPMFVRFDAAGKLAYVANFILNAVQVVDIHARKIVRTIALGGPATPSLARKGEAIFYDGKRSLDQWYSCHSCHYEGHVNAVTMDTRNDGRNGNFKTVLSLRNVTKTGPWTWHGWQRGIDVAMRKSLTDSMLGPEPKGDDVPALVAYLDTLHHPKNPHIGIDGSLSPAAERGRLVFESEKAQCHSCHKPPYYTNSRLYDVDTGERGDAYPTFNPPSLLGTHSKVRWLHDGRAKSLRAVLTSDHAPEKVVGKGELSATELADLLAYLESL